MRAGQLAAVISIDSYCYTTQGDSDPKARMPSSHNPHGSMVELRRMLHDSARSKIYAFALLTDFRLYPLHILLISDSAALFPCQSTEFVGGFDQQLERLLLPRGMSRIWHDTQR